MLGRKKLRATTIQADSLSTVCWLSHKSNIFYSLDCFFIRWSVGGVQGGEKPQLNKIIDYGTNRNNNEWIDRSCIHEKFSQPEQKGILLQ